jgi:hypothetical protein
MKRGKVFQWLLLFLFAVFFLGKGIISLNQYLHQEKLLTESLFFLSFPVIAFYLMLNFYKYF